MYYTYANKPPSHLALSRYGSTCFPTKSLLQAGSLLLELLFHFRGPHLLPSELFTREYPKTGTQLTRPSARQLKRGTKSFNLLLLLFSRLHSTFVAVSSDFFSSRFAAFPKNENTTVSSFRCIRHSGVQKRVRATS